MKKNPKPIIIFENLKSLTCLRSHSCGGRGVTFICQLQVLEAEGSAFQTYTSLGWEEGTVNSALKEQTICIEAQYWILFASSTFPVAASFWPGWDLPFEWGPALESFSCAAGKTILCSRRSTGCSADWPFSPPYPGHRRHPSLQEIRLPSYCRMSLLHT